MAVAAEEAVPAPELVPAYMVRLYMEDRVLLVC